MRKVGLLFLAVLAVFILAGCPAFFEFNLFEPLDLISLPTKAELAAMGQDKAFDLLNRELASPSFVEKLRGDAGARAGIEEYLSDTTGISPMAKGPIAIGLFKIESPEALWTTALYYLKIYYGADLVNNVADLLAGAVEDPTFGGIDENTFEDPDATKAFLEAFLKSIIPPEVLGTEPDAFNKMLTGFQNAWDCFRAIAGGLDGDPSTPADGGFDGNPDTYNDQPYDGDEPFDRGDFVQYSLFAWLIDTVITDNAIWAEEATAREALWKIVNLEVPPDPDGDGSAFENAFSEGSVFLKIIEEVGIPAFFEA